jgi:hypothetical protein
MTGLSLSLPRPFVAREPTSVVVSAILILLGGMAGDRDPTGQQRSHPGEALYSQVVTIAS